MHRVLLITAIATLIPANIAKVHVLYSMINIMKVIYPRRGKRKTSRKSTCKNERSYKLHRHLYLKDRAQDTGPETPPNCTDTG